MINRVRYRDKLYFAYGGPKSLRYSHSCWRKKGSVCCSVGCRNRNLQPLICQYIVILNLPMTVDKTINRKNTVAIEKRKKKYTLYGPLLLRRGGNLCRASIHRTSTTRTWANSSGCRTGSRECWQSRSIEKCCSSSLSLIHIWRCRRIERCRSRWSPYH